MKASRRYPLALRAMHGRSLKLSSIMLTIPKGDECGAALDPVPSYFRRASLCLAYEIYNLRSDADGMSRYRVTYAVRKPDSDDDGAAGPRRTLSYMWESIRGARRGEKPYVKSSFEQRAGAGIVADNLRIDLRSLDPGIYLLVLLVEDLVTGESAGESRTFTISG